MAVTALMYGPIFNYVFGNNSINLTGATVKTALATSTYTPDQDTHDFFNDITNEVTGTGYTAGGATLANDTFTQTTGSNLWTYDADDTSWTTSTITARYGIVYVDTAGASTTDPLIFYENFGGDFTTSAGTFLITWAATGLFTITYT